MPLPDRPWVTQEELNKYGFGHMGTGPQHEGDEYKSPDDEKGIVETFRRNLKLQALHDGSDAKRQQAKDPKAD